MLTAFLLGAFTCQGFSTDQCAAWQKRVEDVVQQPVNGHVNKGQGHSADLHVEVQQLSVDEHVDYSQRVDRVLDGIARDFHAQLTYVPKSPHKVQLLAAIAELGLGLAVMGAMFCGIAQADAGLLSTDFAQTRGEVAATAAQGRAFQPAGATLLTLGLVVAVAMVIWMIAGATQ